MGLLSRLRGDDITLSIDSGSESRTLTRENVPGIMLPYGRHGHPWHHELLDANPSNALFVADAYACVRVLSDAVASLPPKVYRQTGAGRIPVGDDQRLAALLKRPSRPIHVMRPVRHDHGEPADARQRVHRQIPHRHGEITQLGCLPPSQVRLELRGNVITYFLSRVDERLRTRPERRPAHQGDVERPPRRQRAARLEPRLPVCARAQPQREPAGVRETVL